LAGALIKSALPVGTRGLLRLPFFPVGLEGQGESFGFFEPLQLFAECRMPLV
jgi:hypothetical protein